MPYEDSLVPIAYGPDNSWLTYGRSGLWKWPATTSPDDPQLLLVGEPQEPLLPLRDLSLSHASVTPDGNLLAVIVGRRMLTVYHLGVARPPINTGGFSQFLTRFQELSTR